MTRILNLGVYPVITVGKSVYFPTTHPIDKNDIVLVTRAYRAKEVKRLDGGVDLYTVTATEMELPSKCKREA